MRNNLALFFATAGCIGLIPGAPGTYGSVAATAALWLVYRSGGRIVPELHVSVCCLVTALGMMASSRVAHSRGIKDPQFVVIDEVAGQLVTFLLLPLTWMNLLLGTAVFRAFDIWKPYPIRKTESLPGGVGIMADDVLAGVFANLVLQFLNRFSWTGGS